MSGLKPFVRRLLSVWGGADWLLTGAIWLIYYFFNRSNEVHKQDIIVDSNTHMPLGLTYTFQAESISTLELGLLAVALPFGTIIVSYLLNWKRISHWLVECTFCLCGLLLATGASNLLTVAIKLTVGQPRPMFAQLCGWSNTTLTCTGETPDVRKAYTSFPSGHASLSFSGLIYLTLALFHIWRNRQAIGTHQPSDFDNADLSTLDGSVGNGNRDASLASITSPSYAFYPSKSAAAAAKAVSQQPMFSSTMFVISSSWWSTLASFLISTPLCLACFISVTRLRDNYHFGVDVLAGAVIGTGFAFWAASCKLQGVWINIIQNRSAVVSSPYAGYSTPNSRIDSFSAV